MEATTKTATETATETATPPAARPPRDFFLIGILAGIVVLLVVAGVSVALLRQPARELPADTPGGVVQRFLTALERQDYAAAYGYLSDRMARKPTREEFTRHNADERTYDRRQSRIRIDTEKVNGDNATVTVSITHFSARSGPFGGSSEYTTSETFTLQREGGAWRLATLPYRYQPYPAR